MAQRWVYFFGAGEAEGGREMKALLGGKGANLAEMTRIGVPVPSGSEPGPPISMHIPRRQI